MVDTADSTDGTSAGRSQARDAAKIETAYQELKQQIISGTYSPNERLVEAPLTALLGVSRNTLRTVLARLQADGVVVLEPNRGARVRDFTLAEAQDVLRVREALEGLVAGLAAERATEAQIARVRESFIAAENALRDDDLMRFTALNRQFHAHIITASGSDNAAAMLDSLHFPLVKYRFQAVLVPGRKTDELDEHRAVLQAIEARDVEGAERAARAHICHVRATLERSDALTGRDRMASVASSS